MTLKTLSADASKFFRQNVVVSGTLENEGKNYFTDLQVVLKDSQGNRFLVRPWLPTSLPPRPPGTGQAPPTLASFLGKQIELTAVVEKGDLRKTPGVYYLDVKSAKVLAPER